MAGERGAVSRGPARPEAWNDPVHVASSRPTKIRRRAGVILSGEGLQPSPLPQRTPQLEGGAGPVLRKQAYGDRRALRGNEGADRRLRDPPVHVEGRGD